MLIVLSPLIMGYKASMVHYTVPYTRIILLNIVYTAYSPPIGTLSRFISGDRKYEFSWAFQVRNPHVIISLLKLEPETNITATKTLLLYICRIWEKVQGNFAQVSPPFPPDQWGCSIKLYT